MIDFDASEFSPLLFISGGNGVGTSSLASSLAPMVRAHHIHGTDAFREAARMLARPPHNRYDESERAILGRSTFEAWRSLARAGEISRGLPPDKLILDGYFAQTRLVLPLVLGPALRALRENYAAIIEGVHLPLNLICMAASWQIDREEWERLRPRIFRVHVDCDAEVQREHLLGRDSRFAQRDSRRYLEPTNWHAIQTIKKELARINRGNAQVRVDSSHLSLKQEADIVAWRLLEWRLSGGHGKALRFAQEKGRGHGRRRTAS